MQRGGSRPGLGRVAAIAAGVVLFGGCERPGGAPGERIRGEGFELRCDPGCGPRAGDLLADLARTRDSVATWFGVAPDLAPTVLDGERTLRIRLYASEAPFLRADRRLASGRFAQQQAFSHQRSRSAHILTEGSPDPNRWRRFGPGFQGERLAVHEAAHLVTYALARDARWPSWVSEGIASHAEERWAEFLAGPPTAGEGIRIGEPWLHSQRHARNRLLQEGGFPPAAALIRSDLDHLPLPTRYAVWAAFVGVLLEAPFRERTRAFLAEIAGPPPFGGWASETVVRRFEARFDAAALSALDARVREVVAGEEVAWVELRRSAGWTADGLLQLPVSIDPLLWHPATADRAPPSAVTLRVVAERVGPGTAAGSGMLLVLGIRDGALDAGAVGVVVREGEAPGLVRVPLQSDALPREWRKLPEPPVVQAPATAGGNADEASGHPGIRAELVLDQGRLTLRVGGRPEVHWMLPGAVPTGGWGVGTTGGLAALWRELGLVEDGQERGGEGGSGFESETVSGAEPLMQ